MSGPEARAERRLVCRCMGIICTLTLLSVGALLLTAL